MKSIATQPPSLARPAPVKAFEGGASNGRLALPAAHDFVIEAATQRADDPQFRAVWRALAAASSSPEQIQQSPEFFDFLRQKAGVRMEVFSLLRLSDATIVGIVPVRIGEQALRFNIGPIRLGAITLEMATLLGSVPAVPASESVAQYLVVHLLEQFPACKAVLMPALPRHCAYSRHIGRFSGRGRLGSSLMGPWRDCHVLPLPLTFEQYLGQVSSKKRYNIKRQMRQLAEQAGVLALERVDSAARVPAFMEALRTVATDAEIAPLMQEASLAASACLGLLRSYVLRADGVPVGVILATCSSQVLHVHNIFTERALQDLSVGTTVMHLAVKELIDAGGFTRIDFGYGTPNQAFRSTHVLEERAQVLLFDRMKSVSLTFFLYKVFLSTSESAIAMIKSLRKKLNGLRVKFA